MSWKYLYGAKFEYSDGTTQFCSGQGMSENEAIAHAKELAKGFETSQRKIVGVHFEEMRDSINNNSLWHTNC